MFMNWRIIISLLVIIIYCVLGHHSSNQYRLPKTVLPKHYDIELTPHVSSVITNKYTFNGITNITLHAIVANVTEIVLHMNNLYIREYTLVQGIQNHEIISVNLTELTNKFTITLAIPLKPRTEYILSFQYSGMLNDDMTGFYRSNYRENGTVKWLAATQFQPTYARKVFPCFDEPSFKATFQLIINRDKYFQPSFSNTKILNSSLINGRYREVFETTPIISTYLLGFIISEFSIHETADKFFGIISRPDAKNQTKYALTVSPLLLNKFNEWTQHNYYSSLPEIQKMHMAAIPDFLSVSMNNLGLLTYRESALLYAPLVSSLKSQQYVASVIAHEQAHIWFGSLVTCDWWSYLWLNEGFATYFQFYGLAMIEDKWDLDAQFVLGELQNVFYKDSFETTHPMTNNDVNTPSEINAQFDSISYSKGAVILRMIEHIMGSENFHTAIKSYLVHNAFGTTIPEKLYTALQMQTDKVNVTKCLDTWTTQSGYPVVTVKLDKDDRRTVTVQQNRFFLKEPEHDNQTKWEIHLNYASPSYNNKFTNTNTVQILDSNSSSISFQLDKKTDWIIFNVRQTGYYRVNYDNETWRNLAKALKANNHSGIHVNNRAQIINDVLNLARAGLIDYAIVFDILQYLKKEENYVPWSAALSSLKYITIRFNETITKEYKKFFINLSKEVYDKLGFIETETNTRLDIYNRMLILNYNCKYGHKECIKFAKDKFIQLKNHGIPVPVDLRPIVYCVGLEHGHYTEYFTLLQKYLTENVDSEKITILKALGCTPHEWILKEYMNFILTDQVRLQDKTNAFMSIFTERTENVPVVLDFVIESHKQIIEVFGTINKLLLFIYNLGIRFTTKEEIIKLEKFHNDNLHIFEDILVIRNVIAEADYNFVWADKNNPKIFEFLKLANSSTGRLIINILLITFISVFLMFNVV